MRAKVVLSVLVGALAVLVPAIYFHFKLDSPAPAAEQPVATDDSAAPSGGLPPILKRIQSRPQEGLPARRTITANSTETDAATAIVERRAELTELGMSGEPANLKTILAELENPEPEIRHAALSATID